MSIMFWTWLIIIAITTVSEFLTMELVSIWFTLGAIIPFILASIDIVGWEWQLLIFIVISTVLLLSLRKVTKRFLLKNSNEKINMDAIIGKQYKMLSKTDFETIGSLKINDKTWSAIGENQEEINEGDIVEILEIIENKLVVKKVQSKEKKSKGTQNKKKMNNKKISPKK